MLFVSLSLFWRNSLSVILLIIWRIGIWNTWERSKWRHWVKIDCEFYLNHLNIYQFWLFRLNFYLIIVHLLTIFFSFLMQISISRSSDIIGLVISTFKLWFNSNCRSMSCTYRTITCFYWNLLIFHSNFTELSTCRKAATPRYHRDLLPRPFCCIFQFYQFCAKMYHYFWHRTEWQGRAQCQYPLPKDQKPGLFLIGWFGSWV